MVKGGFAYGNLHVSQNDHAIDSFKSILSEHRPTKVLEIGTFHGGLTLILRSILNECNLENTSIRTYDTQEQVFLKPIVKKDALNIEVITKNLFNQPYSDWGSDDLKQEIKDFIDSGSPTLVLCDGGCKTCEFKLCAPMLKPGDIIMAHDYAPTSEFFKKHIYNKVWDWHEIDDDDIRNSCDTYNLVPYMQDIAQKAMWVCKIKNS